MGDVDERLRGLLNADPPESLLALDPADRAELADVVAEAMRRQTQSLAESFDAALRHVPLPVRAIVKRVLA